MANVRRPAATRPARATRTRSEPDERWATAITRIAPNEIEIRGFPVDELMGRLSFAETIYLMLRGELPSPTIGRLFDAVLVSSIDHGVTPPSTLAARNVATTGAASARRWRRASLVSAPGMAATSNPACGFSRRDWRSRGVVRRSTRRLRRLLERSMAQGPLPPGFGHRIHTRDPRAARLCQMAHELDLDGEYCQLMRVVERRLNERPEGAGRTIPINVDGAIAAICGDLGFEPGIANGLFIIARVPGLLAHAAEEQAGRSRCGRSTPKTTSTTAPSGGG